MGEVFAGRYELVDPLGEGGGGRVWRVWDRAEGRFVAAKVLRQVDATSMLRFLREQAVRIDHQHVMTPLGWAGEDDRVLFTMPIATGGSVATLVGDHGPLPLPWALTLLDQVLQGLVEIHGRGVVHRDVKPANMLLDATGTGTPRLRLSDFGVAVALGEPRLTLGPAALGTLGYLAPESLSGADPHPRADLYAVGASALEMLTGASPGPLQPHQDVRGLLGAMGLPAEVARWLSSLCAPDPADRPASAKVALGQLRVTGLVPPPGDDLGGGIEVFDQVTDLPAGWTGADTTERKSQEEHLPEVQQPPVVQQPQEERRPRMLLPVLTLLLGLVLLVSAVLLALG